MIPETATKSKAERHLGATLLRREGNRIALTAVGRDSLRQFLRLGIARLKLVASEVIPVCSPAPIPQRY